MDHSALLRGSENRIMYLYMFSLITFDTFLTTCPKLNSQATDCSVCTHDHHCTYSESLFSSHGESFIADSDEDTLCFVACHSNDVFFGFFGNMVLCKVLQQYVSFNAVILFFFLIVMSYTSMQQRSLLNARLIVISSCRALSRVKEKQCCYIIFGISFLSCVTATCTYCK